MFFQLDKDDVWFPDPSFADEDGLLAIGGDLSSERLQLAYAHGIFPWYNHDTPILWYSPHDRFVLFPTELKISKSMRKEIRNNLYHITFNKAFEQVIQHCAHVPRKEQEGTWITSDMQQAYIALHQQGIALSVEVWTGATVPQLCGGLYGVICGSKSHVFCGESMFSLLPNASKWALINLCQRLPFALIDCQIESEHLKSMGARTITRNEYLEVLHT